MGVFFLLEKILISAKPWQKYMANIILYIMVCISTITFLLCIAAFTIARIDTPDYILVPLTTLLLTVASFLDAFLLGKIYKEKGVAIGVSVGCVFICIITAISMVCSKYQSGSMYGAENEDQKNNGIRSGKNHEGRADSFVCLRISESGQRV